MPYGKNWNNGFLKGLVAIGCMVMSLNAQTLPQQKVFPFDLTQVTLLPGPFKTAMDRKCHYLLWLDNNRLLCSYRSNYKLSTQGAAQYGGWESMAIRGHSMGHVLSALAQAYLSTGDARYKSKADSLVTELQKCQNAAASAGFAAGYLAAIPESDVNTLLNLGNIWAPLYNIHKTFAGLLDCYYLLNNADALDMAKKLGDWTYAKLSPYNHAKYQQFWDDRQSAAGEYGGYNESLAELYKITKTDKYLTASRFFDHDILFNPCLSGQDQLNGLHSNTNIPEIIGALKIYEVSGDTSCYKIAQNFFNIVIGAHTYINGGNGDGEYFKAPNAIASQLSDKTCETCCMYNMLKLSRRLFFFNPLPKYMDFYERGLYNQILASLDTASANGHTTYSQPMRSGGTKELGGDETFWCCDGTGMENHTKYGESIYFYSGDTLLVNLFIPSQLNWTAKGMTVKMETAYPHSDTVRLTITGTGTMPLKIRAPFWLQKAVSAAIDGAPQAVTASAGTYFTINKAWSGSSIVTIVLPQTLRFEKTPDKPAVGGVMYGAQLLAGTYGSNNLSSMPSLDAGTVKKTSPTSLQFSATASTGAVTLIPYYQINQRYSVYWNLTNIPSVNVSFSGAEKDAASLQTPVMSLVSSRLRIGFRARASQDAPLAVSLYTVNGALVAANSGILHKGEQNAAVCLPESISPNMYVCTLRAGNRSFMQLINCTRKAIINAP